MGHPIFCWHYFLFKITERNHWGNEICIENIDFPICILSLKKQNWQTNWRTDQLASVGSFSKTQLNHLVHNTWTSFLKKTCILRFFKKCSIITHTAKRHCTLLLTRHKMRKKTALTVFRLHIVFFLEILKIWAKPKRRKTGNCRCDSDLQRVLIGPYTKFQGAETKPLETPATLRFPHTFLWN